MVFIRASCGEEPLACFRRLDRGRRSVWFVRHVRLGLSMPTALVEHPALPCPNPRSPSPVQRARLTGAESPGSSRLALSRKKPPRLTGAFQTDLQTRSSRFQVRRGPIPTDAKKIWLPRRKILTQSRSPRRTIPPILPAPLRHKRMHLRLMLSRVGNSFPRFR